VAQELHKQNIGTFLFDLLTKEEDELYANRFDIDLLTERLILVTKYVASLPQCSNLSIGYFGASTGAASAFSAAATLPKMIAAVVSRGGRPDLAMGIVKKVNAPTLLIVGEQDYDVLELNKDVYKMLTCEKRMEIIPNATHLFEEPGTLYEAALLATNWFKKYLKSTNKETIEI